MTKRFILKLTGFGFLTWLIPFIASFPFFNYKTQELIIDDFFFKTIMIVLSALVGTILLVLIYKKINQNYIKMGIIIGITWLGINWILDFIFLLPMADMAIGQYFTEIGLRYLVIPIYSIGFALVIKK